jgi:protein TonB
LKYLKRLSTLQIAILVSALIHVLLITVRFVNPEGFNRVFKDTPLEVILVNAKTSEKLDDLKAQAQAIAQYRLNGGGEAAKGLAGSPMPTSQITDMGVAADEAQAQVEQLQAQQMRMLAEIKEQVARLPKPDPKVVKTTDQAEQEKKRRQLLKLLAAIEKRINEETRNPKNATLVLPRGKRLMRFTMTICVARLSVWEPITFQQLRGASYTGSSPC